MIYSHIFSNIGFLLISYKVWIKKIVIFLHSIIFHNLGLHKKSKWNGLGHLAMLLSVYLWLCPLEIVNSMGISVQIALSIFLMFNIMFFSLHLGVTKNLAEVLGSF